jgi:2-polyprenyl-3-methyl-5-hydroxy-6-metoxy-1,4-benzoquinol methylase
MEIDYEDKYFRIEKDHWWSVTRREAILHLVGKMGKKARILEIGCSSGELLLLLNKGGFKDVWGIDISKKAIALCKKKGLKNVFCMDGGKLDLGKNKFDLIIASDVLEHIEDDTGAVKGWKSLLKNNGSMIIFVPAYNSLWSYHDDVNRHFRRYDKKTLVSVMKANRMQILRAGYWNFMLFTPAALFRAISRITGQGKKETENELVNSKAKVLKKEKDKDQFFVLPGFVNAGLRCMLRLENQLLKSPVNYPFGISLFVVAKKEMHTKDKDEG